MADGVPFYEAKYWKRGIPPRVPTLIVLHCMQNQEKPTAAEDCAKWLAGLNPKYPPPKNVSCHYFVDNLHVAQGVRDDCVAFHAPGANRVGIGIEHAGMSSQTQAEWLDEGFGVPMLKRSAGLSASLVVRWGIPTVFRTATDLRSGALDGFTTHAQVTKAWPDISHGHTDPGAGFPVDWYMHEVGLALAALQVPHAT